MMHDDHGPHKLSPVLPCHAARSFESVEGPTEVRACAKEAAYWGNDLTGCGNGV